MKRLALVALFLAASSCATEAQDLYGSENVAAITAAVAGEAVTRIAVAILDKEDAKDCAPCPRAGDTAKVCWPKDTMPPLELLATCGTPDAGAVVDAGR